MGKVPTQSVGSGPRCGASSGAAQIGEPTVDQVPDQPLIGQPRFCASAFTA